jgi:hypothetical protein
MLCSYSLRRAQQHKRAHAVKTKITIASRQVAAQLQGGVPSTFIHTWGSLIDNHHEIGCHQHLIMLSHRNEED